MHLGRTVLQRHFGTKYRSLFLGHNTQDSPCKTAAVYTCGTAAQNTACKGYRVVDCRVGTVGAVLQLFTTAVARSVDNIYKSGFVVALQSLPEIVDTQIFFKKMLGT